MDELVRRGAGVADDGRRSRGTVRTSVPRVDSTSSPAQVGTRNTLGDIIRRSGTEGDGKEAQGDEEGNYSDPDLSRTCSRDLPIERERLVLGLSMSSASWARRNRDSPPSRRSSRAGPGSDRRSRSCEQCCRVSSCLLEMVGKADR